MSDDELAAHRRLKKREAAAAARAGQATYCAYVQKADRPSRLYRIDHLTPSTWRCEVWIGGSIHRTTIAPTRTHMVELRKQYEREVAELLADGWTVTV